VAVAVSRTVKVSQILQYCAQYGREQEFLSSVEKSEEKYKILPATNRK
jgi:hypothetical protein